MFCCSVCNVMFTGVYPESVFSTPCGHLFHGDCIQLCLKKLTKCPVCTQYVDKNKLINIHFQISLQWKDYANDLKNKMNNEVISLDETLNQTLNIQSSNDEPENNSINDSLIKIDYNFKLEKSIQQNYNSKTVLTTSMCGPLTKEMKDILSIFNHIIPNSTIKMRMLTSEHRFIEEAVNASYTNIIIIVIHLGSPIGLVLLDLLEYIKINLTLKSFKYDVRGNIEKIKVPHLIMEKHNKLNRNQIFVQTFFKNILLKQHNKCHEDVINITCCDCDLAMKFVCSSIGLSFYMVIPTI